uniref:Ubiquitin-like protein ATG12 n=1 Tax=Caenorhabditis japonica TaxID=281687 RepID=A0A8R1EIJ5_CAEJA
MDPSSSSAVPESAEPPVPAVPEKVEKVTVMLQAVGDAPILKQRKFKILPTNDIAWLTATIRLMLKLTPDKSLFFYVSHTFAPSPDHTFDVLRKCYAVKGADGSNEVVQLQYSTTPAWG